MCFEYTTFRHFALVVQGIEHKPSKFGVAGSNPAERVIFIEQYPCQHRVQERFINSLAADYRSRLGSLPRTRTTKFNFTFANYYSIIYKQSGCNSIGRVRRLGRRCCRFKSYHPDHFYASVVESVYTTDLKSVGVSLVGSSPTRCTRMRD